MASRSVNLKRAREIKSHINSEFGALSDGRISLQEILQRPQEFEMRRCDVFDVLRRAPKLGRTGAKKILLGSRVWPHDKLGRLSRMELDEILSWLPPRAR
jgi:hypothetical protein